MSENRPEDETRLLDQESVECANPTELVESNSKGDFPERQDPWLNSTLKGRYRIISLVGKGATSAVYKAEDQKTQQMVAIKILHTHLAEDPLIFKRFEQEAKTASLLQHPNVVAVREYLQTETKIPCLVMDFVEGTSLADTLRAAGWLPEPRAIAVGLQVCSALAAAHEKGIVHRDLKPANIMLTTTEDGNLLVKVLDFGIAKVLPAQGDTVMKLTQTGQMLGSILYMSPEQCMDHDLDGRTDCYSLGCVLYEALTGKPPLSARTAFETMNKHMSEKPQRLNQVRPDIQWSSGLEEMLSKTMEKSPDKRYQSILDFSQDLKQLQKGSKPTFAVQAPVAAEIGIPPANDFYTEKLKEYEKDAEGLFGLAMLAIVAIEAIAVQLFIGSLTFDTTYILAFFLVVAMFYAPYKIYPFARRRFHRTKEKIAIIRRREFVQIPILSMKRKYVGFSVGELILQFGASKSHPDLYILNIFPTNPYVEMWRTLCSASEIETVTQQSKVFPIMGEVYFNEKQKPVAVVVRGHLAWTK